MSRKGQSITLSISERDKAELENLARDLGMMWGDRPNISRLVEAIARHQLLIAPNHDWSDNRVKALEAARKALVDLGKMSAAEEIAKLLSDRSELSIPFRAEIEQFLRNPLPTWRQQIDRFIRREQTFRLSYRDVTDRLWIYTVLHACILPLEKRQYLICRTEESEGNQDVEGLHHNWTLRLDRIQEAAVVAINRSWEKDLERIPVEFHLFDRLAFAYERKPEDKFVSELEGDRPYRRVIRNIFNTFWFFREIRPYGKDCVIASPDSMRDRFKQEITAMCHLYDIKTE